MSAGLKLGLTNAECQSLPFGKYFDSNIRPVQPHVADAIQCGGQAYELFPPLERANEMLDEGYWPVETGYARTPDMGLSVFCLTLMPDVTPAMWDWWFGWHGCQSERYKLWHPKAHVGVKWADGEDEQTYIGRTSVVTEYLGSECKEVSISFVPPSQIGLDEARLTQQGEIVVCARIGIPGTPLKGGWLLHHLRPVSGGCEMRSRMWMGGRYSAIGYNPGPLRKLIALLARPAAKFSLPDPVELLVHNAQEMAHLAGFLPALYEEFGPQISQ